MTKVKFFTRQSVHHSSDDHTHISDRPMKTHIYVHKTLNICEYSRCTDIYVRCTHRSKVHDVFDDNHNI